MHAVEPIYQPMLMAGAPADADRVIEVRNPFSGALVGTVPQAEPRQIRAAFAAAARFRPTFSRHDRAEILLGTARAIARDQDRLAQLITAETGLCLKDSLHETRRACDVWSFAAHALIQND